jgi:hypothetical protein
MNTNQTDEHGTERKRAVRRQPRVDGVTVSTRDFEDTHGRLPRGDYRWAFTFGSLDGCSIEEARERTEWAPKGWFSESKKWAVARAKELGVTHVEVCA